VVNYVNAREYCKKASGLIKMHYDLKFRYEAIADAGEYRFEAGKSDACSI